MYLWSPYNCLLSLNKRHVIIGHIKTNSHRIERSCVTYGRTLISDVTAGVLQQFKAIAVTSTIRFESFDP